MYIARYISMQVLIYVTRVFFANGIQFYVFRDSDKVAEPVFEYV